MLRERKTQQQGEYAIVMLEELINSWFGEASKSRFAEESTNHN